MCATICMNVRLPRMMLHDGQLGPTFSAQYQPPFAKQSMLHQAVLVSCK